MGRKQEERTQRMGFSAITDLGRLLVLLVVSALLEVGGDAGMRTGLQGKTPGFVVGGLLLIAYGLVVNLSKMDFSKLMGIYIAIFFVVSQVIALLVFKEKLHIPTLIGGALIILGGCIMTFWRTPN